MNLKGGLGNQMFQYALGFTLAKKKNCKLFCDTRLQEYYKKYPPPRNIPREIDLDIFKINITQANKLDLFKVLQSHSSYKVRKYLMIILDFFGFLALRERKRVFEKRILKNRSNNIYLDGYWQSEKYFIDYRDDILNLFKFYGSENISRNIKFLKKLNVNSSVCLNVRRTDFINNPEHNTITLDYYKKAISILEKKIDDKLNYYIFSDDIGWCKSNFNFLKKKVIVEHRFAGKKFKDYLYLMTKFKYFIIPNSSFAWWGAWLSQVDKKLIIAPKKWSGLYDNDKIDIVPESWIKV